MGTLTDAVKAAIDEAQIKPADKGAAALAVYYAAVIDDEGDVDKTGPLLLAVLDSLLMTPRARAATSNGGDRDDRGSNPLDELRARRGARVSNPEAVDSPAS